MLKNIIPEAFASSFHEMKQPKEPEIDWVENDGFLRDEGVIFGQSFGLETPSDSEEQSAYYWKLQAIRNYYQEKIALGKAQLHSCEERLEQASRAEEHLHQRIDALYQKLEELVYTEKPSFSLLGRNLLLACVSGVTCVLVPFVIVEIWPSGRFSDPFIVALAIGLFGLFAVFYSRSVLLAGDAYFSELSTSPERWKLYALELLPPVTAALFVVLFAYQDGDGWSRLLILFLFLVVLLFVPGRVLMSLLPDVLPGLGSWWRVRRHRKHLWRNYHREIKALKQRLKDITEERRELEKKIPELKSALDFLQARVRWKEALFRSEVHLAVLYNNLRVQHSNQD